MSNKTRSKRRSSRNILSSAPWAKVAFALTAAVALTVAGVVAAVVILRSDGEQGPPSAVIIDQLSLTQPNPSFFGDVRAVLEPAGYQVHYVRGEAVTVDYYRQLPKLGYDIVLVRAHSALAEEGSGTFTDEASLFTGEPYSSSEQVDDQRAGMVTQNFYDETSTDAYFGVAPSFVQHAMKGDFHGALVVLMGCDVLRGDMLSKAFLGRGADAVVGWDGPVSAVHTDAATLSVLGHYLSDGHSAQAAASAAMDELGPDPLYGASLLSAGP